MNDLVPLLTPIDVFDGVMSPAACASLVKYLDATYQSDSTSTAYFNRAAPANTVERALHSVLQEIGDESPVVEYWRRGRWAHVSLHRDIDEDRSRHGTYLHPINGHVMYLEVGINVVGPTSILWETPSGSPMLTTAPAVRGRVVRFNGTLLHAVPRPHDAWLVKEHGLRVGPEHEYAKFAPEAAERRRDVLLFNTWPTLPAGTSPGSPSDSELRELRALAEPRATWQEHAPQMLHAVPPPPLDGGDAAGGVAGADTSRTLTLDLMGDCVRRGRDQRELVLRAPPGAAAALADRSRATTMPLARMSAGGEEGLDASLDRFTEACQRSAARPLWTQPQLREIHSALKSGAEGGVPVLDQIRQTALALAHGAGFELLPNELLLDMVAGLLDLNDVATAKVVLSQAIGPAAARLRHVLRRDPVPLYRERAALLRDPRARPRARWTQATELALGPEGLISMQLANELALGPEGGGSGRLASLCGRRPCVLRRAADDAAAAGRGAGAERAFLSSRCSGMLVRLSTSVASRPSGRSGVDPLRVQRNGAWTSEVPLARFLAQPRAGVFVYELLLEGGEVAEEPAEEAETRGGARRHGCADALARYASPSSLPPEGSPPRLSIAFGAFRTGLGVGRPGRSTLLALREGALDVHTLPLSPTDAVLHLYPEHVLSDRWNGSSLFGGTAAPAEAPRGGSWAVGAHFPPIWPAPTAQGRWPLLHRAHALRVTTSLREGEQLYLPAGVPFYLSSPTVAPPAGAHLAAALWTTTYVDDENAAMETGEDVEAQGAGARAAGAHDEL